MGRRSFLELPGTGRDAGRGPPSDRGNVPGGSVSAEGYARTSRAPRTTGGICPLPTSGMWNGTVDPRDGTVRNLRVRRLRHPPIRFAGGGGGVPRRPISPGSFRRSVRCARSGPPAVGTIERGGAAPRGPPPDPRPCRPFPPGKSLPWPDRSEVPRLTQSVLYPARLSRESSHLACINTPVPLGRLVEPLSDSCKGTESHRGVPPHGPPLGYTRFEWGGFPT